MSLQENRVLVEFDHIPIFQNTLHSSREEALQCPTGNLRLVESSNTGLVYNELFDPSLMTYETNYLSAAETSVAYKDHLSIVADIVSRTLGNTGLIEVGCGQGFFLEALSSKGVEIKGYDPSYKGENRQIEKTYFDPMDAVLSKGLILRHVLEHIDNPLDFLDKLKGQGVEKSIYIEVPCFDWICEHKSWVDIFYEHVNYFRLSDFERMFGKIFESGHLFGGQYLYIVADLASLRVPQFDADSSVDFPDDFMTMQQMTHQSSPMVVWGAASKGVMFAYHMKKMGHHIEAVIDINPLKQGKFLPSTGVQIQSAQDALAALPLGSSIYVMNERYLNEVKMMTQNSYNYLSL